MNISVSAFRFTEATRAKKENTPQTEVRETERTNSAPADLPAPTNMER